jgi:hypothetical protein
MTSHCICFPFCTTFRIYILIKLLTPVSYVLYTILYNQQQSLTMAYKDKSTSKYNYITDVKKKKNTWPLVCKIFEL